LQHVKGSPISVNSVILLKLSLLNQSFKVSDRILVMCLSKNSLQKNILSIRLLSTFERTKQGLQKIGVAVKLLLILV
jgi:hypothetical protein